MLQKNVPSLEQQLHLLFLLVGRGELSDENIIRCLRFTSSLLEQQEAPKLTSLQLHTEVKHTCDVAARRIILHVSNP